MVLDLSIPDLYPLSYFKQLPMAKDSFKDYFENINILLKITTTTLIESKIQIN